MTLLHIINTSPAMRSSLQSCLRVAQKHHAILLIEDAVIAARKNSATESIIESVLQRCKVYVLEPDLLARGIKTQQIITGIELVDYPGFVQLTVDYSGVQSWN